MIDTKDLRRLAQAATPGPWHFWHGWVAADIDRDGGVIIAERPTPSGGKYQARVDGNFRFIAAANPAAISELLDRLEAAERERDNYKVAYNEWTEKTEWVQRGINDGTIPPKYLGWHRVDAVAHLLSAAEKERDNLRTENEGLVKDMNLLRNNNVVLRAKIEAMERCARLGAQGELNA